jgi:cell division septal protein FtsQ
VIPDDRDDAEALKRRGEAQVELHSERESDRVVLAFRGPEGEAATVIVMRRSSKVWLVFNGAVKTTVAMSDAQAAQLVAAVRGASRGSTSGFC